MSEKLQSRLLASIRTIKDYPKEGIMFYDITTLLREGELFALCIDELKKRYENLQVKYICGIEARGFIFGAALAYALGIGFVPIRKAGKLPAETSSLTYELEYGSDTIEIHKGAIAAGESVILIDDLLATGGTALASIELLKDMGAVVLEAGFMMSLNECDGFERLSKVVSTYSILRV